MSTIRIDNAKRDYGGATEEETLRNLAKAAGLKRIYKYRHASSEDIEYTHYKQVTTIGDWDEVALFNSNACKDIILVYDRGKVQNLSIKLAGGPAAKATSRPASPVDAPAMRPASRRATKPTRKPKSSASTPANKPWWKFW